MANDSTVRDPMTPSAASTSGPAATGTTAGAASTFSADAQHRLAALPQLIGSAMAMAGASGIIGTGKEMFANASGMMEGAKAWPNNSIIHGILPDLKNSSPSAEMDKARALAEETRNRMKAAGVDSAEKMRDFALSEARGAAQLLAGADPREAQEYRQWVMQIAEKVANAATEGGFLGFGGERLSEPERKLLGELRAALGATA